MEKKRSEPYNWYSLKPKKVSKTSDFLDKNGNNIL